MSSEQRAHIYVFCSYSDEDRRFQENLEKHLTSLVREGSILVWAKHKVRAGQERQREIDDQLEQARLILLLISSNFISSDDCYTVELVRALQRHHDDNVCVIPILLKPCTWDELAFSAFQVLPRNRVPVSLWPNRDEAFTHVVEEIKIVVKDLLLYGKGYMEPLQPNPVKSFPSRSVRPPSATRRTRTTQARSAAQKQGARRSRKQTHILREDATMATNTRYIRRLSYPRSISGGNTIGRFFTYFFSNLSGRAFERRCKRWKGNSALLLVAFAIIDIFLLPYIVFLRWHAQNIAVALGILSLLLFFLGVFSEENAIGVPIAVIYFPMWMAVSEWYLNSYLRYGLSQLTVLILIFIITICRLLLFLWRSPFGYR
jgi:hypothetical protein